MRVCSRSYPLASLVDGTALMSVPREVLPARFYMITRRCTQRQFLLRPDRETNNNFLYCLAEAAARFDNPGQDASTPVTCQRSAQPSKMQLRVLAVPGSGAAKPADGRLEVSTNKPAFDIELGKDHHRFAR